MEDEVKTGVLSIQKSGILKTWQKKWIALYKRSSHGVPRIEIFDSKENFEKRLKGSKKCHVLSLGNCVNITKSINESKKSDFHLHMTFSDNEKQQILAMESENELISWYSVISRVVFGGGGSMEVNSLYQAYEEETFEVTIKENENAIKLNLKGVYNLAITNEDLELRKGSEVIVSWPLHLLRKYGRDKQEFSLEAGRRCPSGPGMFYFITERYNAIFQEVENKVKSLASRNRAQSSSSFHGVRKSPTTSVSSMSPEVNASANTSCYADPVDVKKLVEKNGPEPVYNEPHAFQPATRPPPAKGKKVAKVSPTKAKQKTNKLQLKDKKAKNTKTPSAPPISPVFIKHDEPLDMAYGKLDLNITNQPTVTVEGSYDSLQWNSSVPGSDSGVNPSAVSDYASAEEVRTGFKPPPDEENMYDQVIR